jgi:poly(hydroxyalkanoate) depolymerase family esterase
MRRLAVLVAVAVAAAVSGFASAGPARASTGAFTQHTWPSTGAPGARDYWVYVPAGPAVAGRPLVVFLHGCTQTAIEAAQLSRFNELADRLNFVVAYPQQNTSPTESGTSVDGNSAGCWNWFIPENETRDIGEAATVAGITRQVMADQQIDPDRVYVEGISAGADMAVNMGAAYPDLYAAIGALAGCPYADCSDTSGSLASRAMGAHARPLPVFVEQGTADVLNNEAMGAALVQQWLGTNDLLDDGAANGSVSRIPASTSNYGFDQTPQPGSGDACVRPRNFPCAGGPAGFQGTYPYTVQRYADAHGCDLVDSWTVHGLAHAYPGGDPQSAFTDPLGPDVTTAAYQFFLAHPKSGGCPSP